MFVLYDYDHEYYAVNTINSICDNTDASDSDCVVCACVCVCVCECVCVRERERERERERGVGWCYSVVNKLSITVLVLPL